MRITIAICTWNRCDLLRRTLQRLTEIAVPDSVAWDVLVVNNNSSDRTEEAIDAFRGALPLRSVFEPQPGLSHARNRALSEYHFVRGVLAESRAQGLSRG
jgi:glycosyltransferase involved in cell wall biosynthesis